MITRKGFTLVELLVVMTIISLLAAILLPVLSSTMKIARQIQCINNQKQLMYGIIKFADDNNDRIVGNSHDSKFNDTDPQPQTDPMKRDWLRGDLSYSESIQNNGSPESGTLFPYIEDKLVYRCSALSVGSLESKSGGNGLFDYSILSSLTGTKLDNLSRTMVHDKDGFSFEIPLPIFIEETPETHMNIPFGVEGAFGCNNEISKPRHPNQSIVIASSDSSVKAFSLFMYPIRAGSLKAKRKGENFYSSLGATGSHVTYGYW